MGFSLKKLKKLNRKLTRPADRIVDKVARKTMPKQVYKISKKAVQNPIVRAVALSVATMGAGAAASGAMITSRMVATAAVKGGAVGYAKGRSKKLNEKAARIAAQKFDTVASDPQMLATTERLVQSGVPAEKINEMYVGSDNFAQANFEATNAIIRDKVKSELKAEGVPESQLEKATDLTVAQIADNAHSEVTKKTDSKWLLALAPVALSLMMGA